MVRIVAGRFRGRKLVTPATGSVRPTADRMKESVFNVLQEVVPQSRVLDLYAGAGNLGLEAVSRGARQVVFVERDAQALRALRRNLVTLQLSEPRTGGSTRLSSAPALQASREVSPQAKAVAEGRAETSTKAFAKASTKESVEVIAGDAIRFLRQHVGDAFDLILADPPYDADAEEALLGALRQQHLVPGGIVVFQHRADWSLQPTPEGFELLRPRRFGKTVIDFLQRREEEDV